MSGSRLNFERKLEKMKLYGKSMEFKRKINIKESPVGTLDVSAMLITNMRKYLYPHQIPLLFRCIPPSLDTYIVKVEKGGSPGGQLTPFGGWGVIGFGGEMSKGEGSGVYGPLLKRIPRFFGSK